MIIAIYLGASLTVLTILIGLLDALADLIPASFLTNLESSFSTLIGYLGYFNGVFPVDTLLLALQIYIYFLIAMYSYKLVINIFALLPFTRDLINFRDRTSITEGESDFGGHSRADGKFASTRAGSSRFKVIRRSR